MPLSLALLKKLRIEVQSAYLKCAKVPFEAQNSKDDPYIKSLQDEIESIHDNKASLDPETLRRFFFIADKDFTSSSFRVSTVKLLTSFVSKVVEKFGSLDIVQNQSAHHLEIIQSNGQLQKLESYLKKVKASVATTSMAWKPSEAVLKINEIIESRFVGFDPESQKYHDSGGFDCRNTSLLKQIIDGRRILVIGEPGAGKSTFAKWIAYNLIENSSKQLKNVPIYFELKYIGSDIYNAIFQQLHDLKLEQYEESLVFPEIKVHLVLDGLDEIDSQSKFYKGLILSLQKFPISSILLTSRQEYAVKEFAFTGFIKYAMLSLWTEDITSTSEKILGQKAVSGFNKYLKDPEILEMARNHLFLNFLLTYYSEKGHSFRIENRGQLLKDVITTSFFKFWETDSAKHETDKQHGISVEEILLLIQFLAYRGIKSRDMKLKTSIVHKIIDDWLKKTRKISEIQVYAIRNYILDRLDYSQVLSPEKKENMVFNNRVIKEFFAGMEMVRIYDKRRDPISFYKAHKERDWDEPFKYFMNFVEGPQYFVKDIYNKCCSKDRPSGTLMFCIKWTARNYYVKRHLLDKIIPKLEIIVDKFYNRVRIWDKRGNWICTAMSFIVNLDHKQIPILFSKAIKRSELGPQIYRHMLGSTFAEAKFEEEEDEIQYNPLDLFLTLEDFILSGYVLKACLAIVNKKSIDRLTKLLESEAENGDSAYFAFSFVDSPFYIGNVETNPQLRTALPNYIRKMLSSTFAYQASVPFNFLESSVIEDVFVIPLLKVIEADSEKSIRINAIRALACKSSKNIAPSLYKWLKEGDYELRCEIVLSMEYIPIEPELEDRIFNFLMTIFPLEDDFLKFRILNLLKVRQISRVEFPVQNTKETRQSIYESLQRAKIKELRWREKDTRTVIVLPILQRFCIYLPSKISTNGHKHFIANLTYRVLKVFFGKERLSYELERVMVQYRHEGRGTIILKGLSGEGYVFRPFLIDRRKTYFALENYKSVYIITRRYLCVGGMKYFHKCIHIGYTENLNEVLVQQNSQSIEGKLVEKMYISVVVITSEHFGKDFSEDILEKYSPNQIDQDV